jgi:hypothetical protein
MRKHRFIGFVLTAATVLGPLSLSATTPASAAVVVSGGGASWRLPLINLPLPLDQALPSSGPVVSGATRLTAFLSEFGTQLPVRLEGDADQRPAEVARRESSQLSAALRRADDAELATLVAARAAMAQSVRRYVVVSPVSAPVTASSGDVWAELRDCESGGNYAEDTGNGFYGAYQFAPGTWTALGYSGLPNEAPPAVQDAAAQQLQSRSGWGQWPGCSAKLGL